MPARSGRPRRSRRWSGTSHHRARDPRRRGEAHSPAGSALNSACGPNGRHCPNRRNRRRGSLTKASTDRDLRHSRRDTNSGALPSTAYSWNSSRSSRNLSNDKRFPGERLTESLQQRVFAPAAHRRPAPRWSASTERIPYRRASRSFETPDDRSNRCRSRAASRIRSIHRPAPLEIPRTRAPCPRSGCLARTPPRACDRWRLGPCPLSSRCPRARSRP